MERKQEIIRLYDETAPRYDSRYQEIQVAKLKYLSNYLPEKINKLLDVGCGTGLLLAEMEWRADEAFGVDLSAGMLEIAKRRCRRAKLVQADAEHLPFADETFDCVISFTLLQNLSDPPAAVREMARVLKKGGTAIITSLKYKHSAEEMKGWAEAAGLKVVAWGTIEKSEDNFCVCRK